MAGEIPGRLEPLVGYQRLPQRYREPFGPPRRSPTASPPSARMVFIELGATQWALLDGPSPAERATVVSRVTPLEKADQLLRRSARTSFLPYGRYWSRTSDLLLVRQAL